MMERPASGAEGSAGPEGGREAPALGGGSGAAQRFAPGLAIWVLAMLTTALCLMPANADSPDTLAKEAISICRNTPYHASSSEDKLLQRGWQPLTETDRNALLSASTLAQQELNPGWLLGDLDGYHRWLKLREKHPEAFINHQVLLARGDAPRAVIAFSDYHPDRGVGGRCLIAMIGSDLVDTAEYLLKASDNTARSQIRDAGEIHQYVSCGSPKSRTDKMQVSLVKDDHLWELAGGRPLADLAIQFEYETRKNCNLHINALQGRFDGD